MNQEALKLLQEIEWSADFGRKCSICGWKKPKHYADCELAQAISLLEAQPGDLPVGVLDQICRMSEEIERLKERLNSQTRVAENLIAYLTHIQGKPPEYEMILKVLDALTGDKT